jgi:uncharacterized protein
VNLKDQIVLITGGNSGLGFEVARELVQKNCQIIILGKDKKKVEEAKKTLNSDKISTVICDLRDAMQIQEIMKNYEKIDVLINCAGIINYQPLESHDPKNVRDLIETNLLGTIFITQAVLPKMIRQNYGTIVNVSSTSGLNGGHAEEAVYTASKYGVSGFTESLKKEIEAKKKNIKIIGFYPGGMNTQLFTKSGLNKDTSKFMDPAEIAKIMVFILERPDAISMDQVVINRNKNL